jgi:protein-S-isoprenylcysteine O-methyltransferase Ste14
MALLLKNLLFSVLVPGTVAVWLPHLIVGDRPASEGALRLAALLALALGGSIYAWCVWDFASFGRGTPAPIDAPQRLVVRGLYRATRNPMYLGVLTVIAGWALWFHSPLLAGYAALVAAAFHTFVVAYEEGALRSAFGAEYDAYCVRVPRWLPRPGRR